MNEVIFQSINDTMTKFWDNFYSFMNNHGYHILLIIFIAYLTKRFGVEIIMKLLEKTVRNDLYPTKADRTKRLKTLKGMIGAILQAIVTIIAVAMIVSELGVDTAPLIASAGILGVAIGFGAQSLIKDLTSGLFIIIENQYRVGDTIELNNQIQGEVQAITIRTTVIRNVNGTLFHVPNGTIGWTANKTMSYGGISEEIIFPADIDIEKLSMLIDRVSDKLLEDPEVAKKIKEPPKLSKVLGFHNDGVNIRITGRTGSDNAIEVKDLFYRLLIKELRRAKISIPTTQITVTNKKPTT